MQAEGGEHGHGGGWAWVLFSNSGGSGGGVRTRGAYGVMGSPGAVDDFEDKGDGHPGRKTYIGTYNMDQVFADNEQTYYTGYDGAPNGFMESSLFFGRRVDMLETVGIAHQEEMVIQEVEVVPLPLAAAAVSLEEPRPAQHL